MGRSKRAKKRRERPQERLNAQVIPEIQSVSPQSVSPQSVSPQSVSPQSTHDSEVSSITIKGRNKTRLMRRLSHVMSGARRVIKETAYEDFHGVWDYLIIVVSLSSLVTLILQLNSDISPDLHRLLYWFDATACGIFFIDFSVRLAYAPSKRDYMRWGWLDLISSIPTLDHLRWGRVFRLIRIIRVIRHTWSHTKRVRFQDPILTAVMVYFLSVFFGAVGVLYLESGVAGASITSARDAVWWAMVTVTTVGYGDFTPVTSEGRVLAVLLMSSGIGLFGVFSARCTQYLMNRLHDGEDDELKRVQESLNTVHQELHAVRTELNTVRTEFERVNQTLTSVYALLRVDRGICKPQNTEPQSTEPQSTEPHTMGDHLTGGEGALEEEA